MTREEAIARIKEHMLIHKMNEPRAIHISEALVMAIKALELEPCEDIISRQAAIEALKEHRALFCDNTPDTFSKLSYAEKSRVDELDTAIATLVNLPSAQPEQRWIPCSEWLPEEMGTYMTTIDYGEHGLVTGQRYYFGRGLKWNDECVIAWMPLPNPYKAERKDNE